MKILFLISSFNKGGAELQLATLANLLKRRGHEVKAAVSYPGGYYEKMLDQGQIPVIDLKKKSKLDPGFYFRLYRILKEERPDIVHSYMPASNIQAALVGFFMKRIRIVWGIRASNMDLSRYSTLSKILYSVEPFFSRRADLIISNSESARSLLIERNFDPDKIRVICNGINTNDFVPLDNKKVKPKEQPVRIGTAARIDPMKGYEVFIQAIKIFADTYPDKNVEYIAAGGGNKEYFDQLLILANRMGIGEKINWLGERNEMAQILNGFDIYTSSSIFGEGFSNSICEAMSCGIPCVVTDVGDSANIVGDTGIVVKPGDSRGLAEAWFKMINADLEALGERARSRIENNYSLEKLADNTEKALMELI